MSEWIEKEEVLKQIDCWFTTGEYKYSNATHYLNKRISSIKPKESEWVSVKDKLPDEDTWVLVYAKQGSYMNLKVDYIHDGRWFNSLLVTHWAQLPELPKENVDGIN